MTPYTVSTTKTKADVFRKAIKPNVDDYDELKYDKQWDWWKNGTSITATLHGTQNVLNPDYLPTTTDDYDWFRQINYFMFNMFRRKLKTSVGEHLVRQNFGTLNAQAVYRGLLHYYYKSAAALVSKSHLLNGLMQTRYETSGFRGGTHAYLLRLIDRFREYNSLCNRDAERLHPVMQRMILQQSISGVPELHLLKTQLEIQGKTLDSDDGDMDYVELLLSHASTYDKAKEKRSSN